MPKTKPTTQSLATVRSTRSADGSFSSGGVGRFRSAYVAATVMDTRKKLQAHVDAAGSDPVARKAALLSYFAKK